MNDWLGGEPGASGYNYSPRDKERVTRKVGAHPCTVPRSWHAAWQLQPTEDRQGSCLPSPSFQEEKALPRSPRASLPHFAKPRTSGPSPSQEQRVGGGGRHMGGRQRLGVLQFTGGWKSSDFATRVNTLVPPEMWQERQGEPWGFSFCSSHGGIATKGSAVYLHGSQLTQEVTVPLPRWLEPRSGV